ncbi:putative Uncharacterized 50.6 kDa protein in the 5'region of gyrA and gyrB [Burkholderia vietnamiensis]|nr:putative Uncharacterized 50.6 kDa protein in the 5'region of gyrA and gyrB [Burkholderia vietnamiensis]
MPARRVGQRQDHAAARGGRPRTAVRRAHPARRPRVLRRRTAHRPARRTALARPRVPVVRAVAAPHRRRQRRLRAHAAPRGGCRTEAPRAGRARPARPRSSGRTLPASTVGRPAAARRDRARARLQPAGDPARRAAVEPRREAARGSAGVAARTDRVARAVGAVRDARPDRGDGDVRPHPAAAQRPHRAGRHAGRAVRRTALAVHGRIHGQQQPDRCARRGRRRRERDAGRRRLAAAGARARHVRARPARAGRDPARTRAGRRRPRREPAAGRSRHVDVSRRSLGIPVPSRRHAAARVRPRTARGGRALDRIPGQRLLGVREGGLSRLRRPARRRIPHPFHPAPPRFNPHAARAPRRAPRAAARRASVSPNP